MTGRYGNIDKECEALCDAINRMDGIRTVESCCGHGDHPFMIWIGFTDLKEGWKALPILLYYLDP